MKMKNKLLKNKGLERFSSTKTLWVMVLVGVIFLCLPSINAQTDDKISYEPNETMHLVLICKDTNSNLCEGTDCTIDVYYPNMTLYQQNKPMIHNSTNFYYDCPGVYLLGNYHAMANCSDGTTAGVTEWDFYVGRPSTESQSNMTILAIILLFALATLLFLGFFKTEKFIFKWSFFLFSLLFIVISLNIVSIALFNEAGTSTIRSIFDTLGAICYYMYWFIGGILLIIWILTTIASLADRKHMQQARAIGEPINFS